MRDDLGKDAMAAYAAIREAAEKGAPAPSPDYLALIGRRKDARGLMKMLGGAGLITIERRSDARVVRRRIYVAEIARWTGWLIQQDKREAPPRTENEIAADRLLDRLREIARSGAELPSGHDLEREVGLTSGTIDSRLRMLKRHGMIEIEAGRDRHSRRIFVVDVGLWTAWTRRPTPKPAAARAEKWDSQMPDREVAALFRGRRFTDAAGFDRVGRPVMIDRRRNGFVATGTSLATLAAA